MPSREIWLAIAVLGGVLAGACGKRGDGDGGGGGGGNVQTTQETQRAGACDAPPCSWGEVPPAVRRRTREVAEQVFAAQAAGRSATEAAAAVKAERDVEVLWSDDHVVRFQVRGGRPAWAFLNDSLLTKGGGAGGQAGSPSSVKPPAGHSESGVKPLKRALILSPFRWQWQMGTADDETDKIHKLIDARNDYKGRVEVFESTLRGSQIEFGVGIEQFRSWNKYDSIHVSTHGASCALSDCGGAPCKCLSALATGDVFGADEWDGGGARKPTALEALLMAEQGIDVMFIAFRQEALGEFVTLSPQLLFKPVKQDPTKAMDGAKGWMAGPFVLVTSRWFQRQYPDRLTDKVIFLSACSAAKNMDLVNALAGPESAVIGWNKVMNLTPATEAAVNFWNHASTGWTVDDSFKIMGGSDGVKVGSGPTKAVVIEGVVTKDDGTGARLEREGQVETRATEIVSLVHLKHDRELRDGDSLSLEGVPGDGAPDKLKVRGQIIGIDDEHAPELEIHLNIDGQPAPATWKATERVAAGVWRGEASIALGVDVPIGKRFKLEPWVELPGGGVSRWIYEDIAVEYFAFTISGPGFASPQTFSLPTKTTGFTFGQSELLVMFNPRGEAPGAVSSGGSFTTRFIGALTFTKPEQPGSHTQANGFAVFLYPSCAAPKPYVGCRRYVLNSKSGTLKLTRYRMGKEISRPHAEGPNIAIGTFEITADASEPDGGGTFSIRGGFHLVDYAGRW